MRVVAMSVRISGPDGSGEPDTTWTGFVGPGSAFECSPSGRQVRDPGAAPVTLSGPVLHRPEVVSWHNSTHARRAPRRNVEVELTIEDPETKETRTERLNLFDCLLQEMTFDLGEVAESSGTPPPKETLHFEVSRIELA